MDSGLERPGSATLLGQLGCSVRSEFWKSFRPSHQSIHSGVVVALCIPRCGANHPPQTGSRHARLGYPQSGFPFPEMLHTFQGVGRKHQGVEAAPPTEAPRTPGTHLILLLFLTEQRKPHLGPL